MQDENLATPQEGTNPEPEVVEETVVEETTETPAEETHEETVPKSQLAQVVARAKKAEAELKALKEKASNGSITKTNSLSEEEVDAKILKSQGMADDLIQELKVIAKARGKSILDTLTDPIFTAIKQQKETQVKEQKAKLGASKGSGSVKKEKNFNSTGLTDEEHKAMWRQQIEK